MSLHDHKTICFHLHGLVTYDNKSIKGFHNKRNVFSLVLDFTETNVDPAYQKYTACTI